MTIKIRELTIKANIVGKRDKGEPSSRQTDFEKERPIGYPAGQDAYDNELKKRRER